MMKLIFPNRLINTKRTLFSFITLIIIFFGIFAKSDITNLASAEFSFMPLRQSNDFLNSHRHHYASQNVPSAASVRDLNQLKELTNVVVGLNSSLKLLNDLPVIAYYDATNGDLKLTSCSDIVCSVRTTNVISSVGNVGLDPSMVFSNDQLPVISFYDVDTVDLHLLYCDSLRCANPTEKIIDTAGEVGLDSSLTLNSSGNPVISYYDQTNKSLKIAICLDTYCTTNQIKTLDIGGTVGWYTSLILTGGDLPVIAYFDFGNRNLNLVRCHDQYCGTLTKQIIDSSGDVGWFPDIELTNSGTFVIAYQDRTNEQVKIAECLDANCDTTRFVQIGNPGYSGAFSSLELTNNDVPIVSFYDWVNLDLMIADCVNFSCDEPVITTIDTAGDIGKDTSLVLSTHDVPIITYFDNGNGNLKLAIAPQTIDSGRSNQITRTAPINNEIVGRSRVTLQWKHVDGITSYEYCISISPTLCTIWLPTVENSIEISPLADFQTYYWRVRGVTEAGLYIDDGGTASAFSVQLLPTAPVKIAPANKSRNQANRVTLRWSRTSDATAYEYCINVLPKTCSKWTNVGSASSVTITNLQKGKTYLWEVRSRNSSGVSAIKGSGWTFQTAP